MILRNILPKTLFLRGILIVVLPVLLVQVITAHIFYNRHWENVTRHMAIALAGEVTFAAYLMAKQSPETREQTTYLLSESSSITAEFFPGAELEKKRSTKSFPELREQLSKTLLLPYVLTRAHPEADLDLRVQLRDGVLALRLPAKRLESPTILIQFWWMFGASAFFLIIAIIFLRNQVRPMQKLAEAAEQFGKGQEIGGFKPTGALEVRRAARAFLLMRERILRQVRTRTEMLAGISHDLRTPLARIKLQLAMAKDLPGRADLEDDVKQMEHMIQEYLEFARGASGEEGEIVSVKALLEDIIGDYQRLQKPVQLQVLRDREMVLRPQAFRRMIENLVDNALHYGTRALLILDIMDGYAHLTVEDDGPGIPEEKREEVFRPFTRLDAARNLNEGGAGLGLTIARDVALNHGGTLVLENSSLGGVKAIARLPL